MPPPSEIDRPSHLPVRLAVTTVGPTIWSPSP